MHCTAFQCIIILRVQTQKKLWRLSWPMQEHKILCKIIKWKSWRLQKKRIARNFYK